MRLFPSIYSATPGVDVEVESVGEAMRAAIWDLFEADIYNTPEEIREVFDALLDDIAVAHGYVQRADGTWFTIRGSDLAGAQGEGL